MSGFCDEFLSAQVSK